MKVRYTVDALLHITDIHAYIAEHNTIAASRVIERIRSACERLGGQPMIGHEGAATSTLEWSVVGLPYVIVYEANDNSDELVVLGVYHGAQLRPGRDLP